MSDESTPEDRQDEKIVRAVRTTRELWNAYGESVALLGTDRAKHINAFMCWVAREPGAKMPRRPAARE